MRVYSVVSAVVFSVFLVSAGAEGGMWDMSMPTIESPSLGTGFYTPSASASPFMSGRSSQSSASGQSAGSSSSSQANSGKASDSSSASVKDSSKSSSTLSRTLQNSISARDLENLDSLGLLGGLSGILSEGYGSSLYSYASNSSALAVDRTEETNRLLTRVLEKMEEIKEQGDVSRSSSGATLVSDQGEAPADSSASASSNGTSSPSVKNKSRLLRFAVNGYNVLRTCRTVYISDVQDDGTFLVTGDRRYMSDGQTRTETFHILFRTRPGVSSLSEYDAATAVTQDSYNPNSFVYQLSKRSNMMASRTGNLVSMRTEDPDWRLELLIDLAE
ncbi:MAG: hypothetical protein IJU95_00625 [Treponema sp.]|nr:hypothetical protein [Treponema sp.]